MRPARITHDDGPQLRAATAVLTLGSSLQLLISTTEAACVKSCGLCKWLTVVALHEILEIRPKSSVRMPDNS
eukprot:6178002-Pleurochrysis_carterae.AAC.6